MAKRVDEPTYTVDPNLCKGCTMCAKVCPTDAIVGSVKTPHYIVEERCIRCGSCIQACKLNAIIAN